MALLGPQRTAGHVPPQRRGVYHQLNHDLVKTQRAMGHKSINSTEAYHSFVEEGIDQGIPAS